MNDDERTLRRESWINRMLVGETMQSIADSAGVSRERVRQVVGPFVPRRKLVLLARLREELERNPRGTAEELSKAAGYLSPQAAKLRSLGWTAPPRPLGEHGTTKRFGQGCRCDACRGANRDRHDRWSARHLGNPPAHGTNNGYSNYGCRCDACRAANSAYQKRGRERRNAVPTAGGDRGAD